MIVIFLDMTKACICKSHCNYVLNVRSYNVIAPLLPWIFSYSTFRIQLVSKRETLFKPCLTAGEAIQYSLQGFLRFHTLFQRISHHSFADGKIVYFRHGTNAINIKIIMFAWIHDAPLNQFDPQPKKSSFLRTTETSVLEFLNLTKKNFLSSHSWTPRLH